MLEFSLSSVDHDAKSPDWRIHVSTCKLVCNMLAMLAHFTLHCSLFLERVPLPLGFLLLAR